MITGRITRVDGIKATATFYNRFQPYLIEKGKATSSPRINSYVKTGIGLDTVICQIVGEHEVEYDRLSGIAKSNQPEATGPFLVDLEVRGYISNGEFKGGLRCLPIVGATIETLEDEDLKLLYSSHASKPMRIGRSIFDESQTVFLDANKLMASHIGVFGNTGSGKSNTLARIIKNYISYLPEDTSKSKIIIFDLNNEYGDDAIVQRELKSIYHLTTRRQKELDKIPLDLKALDVDSWGIILRATQRTQMPVVRRAYYNWRNKTIDNFINEIKRSIVDKRSEIFFTLRNYCPDFIKGIDNLSFHQKGQCFYYRDNANIVYIDTIEDIRKIEIDPKLDDIQEFLLWLSLEAARTAESGINFEFIQPLLPRARGIFHDLRKIISKSDGANLSAIFNDKPIAVIQLGDVNAASREMLTSLLSELILKEAIENKGSGKPSTITTLVIDEAHNLLGYDSEQSDSIHGNTLHVFETIIKEGRKFGVFLCLASQRPSDISATITAQIHNYFIHRLVNPNDIERIRRTVSFMGDGSLSMLSALGQGECIISGPSLYMPQYAYVDQLDAKSRPNSNDIQLFGDGGILE